MIILDTHALLWFINDRKKLSEKALKNIEEAKRKKEIIISSITIWEISLLVKKERLKLIIDLQTWIKKIESINYLKFISVDNEIAHKSVYLLSFLNADPADRIIVATSLVHVAPIITADQKILKYPHVQSIW